MTCCHVLVESLNCVCPRHLSVLFVHVVGAGAGIVSNPDAEVLNLLWALLVYLLVGGGPVSFLHLCIGNTIFNRVHTYHIQRHNLAIRLFDLS